MCELSFVNMASKSDNFLMGMFLVKVGSGKNDDGTGFITIDQKIWKSEIAADMIINLGEIFSDQLVSEHKFDPVAFHVRAASRGIAVNEENAHPFNGEFYILMHNGSLANLGSKKDEDPAWFSRFWSKSDKENVDSDSLNFLKEMDAIKKENIHLPFVEIINKTMQKFEGKFAFIILDKSDNTFYIIRGITAPLYISYFYKDLREDEDLDSNKVPKKSPDGYVINTNKNTLLYSINLYKNVKNLLYKGTENIFFSEPALIEKESIYKAGEIDIVKIGDIKENIPETALVVQAAKTPSNAVTKPVEKNSDEFKKDLALVNKVSIWAKEHSLSILDIQILFANILGKSLLELEEADIKYFLEEVVPKISAPKKLRNKLLGVLRGNPFPIDVYKIFNLAYPWMLNDEKIISEIIDKK